MGWRRALLMMQDPEEWTSKALRKARAALASKRDDLDRFRPFVRWHGPGSRVVLIDGDLVAASNTYRPARPSEGRDPSDVASNRPGLSDCPAGFQDTKCIGCEDRCLFVD